MIAIIVFLSIVAQVSPTPPSTPAWYSGTLGLIKPPSRWIRKSTSATISVVDVANSFISPAGNERILLGRVTTTAVALRQVVRFISETITTSRHQRLVASHTEDLCLDGADAAYGWFFEYVDATSRSRIEETVLVGRDHAAAALYLRNNDTPEDSRARRALDSLCLVPFE